MNSSTRGLVIAWLVICSAFANGEEKVSVKRGDELFHSRSLGAPTKTGVPYALWLAMMDAYPRELGANWAEFRDKFGLLVDPTRPGNLPIGFVTYDTKLTATRFLMTNCSMCHTGEINGQVIHGLGSRTLRINALNTAIVQIASRQDFTPRKMLPIAAAAARRNGVPWGWRSRLVTRKAIEQLQAASANYVERDAGSGRNTVLEFTKAILKQPIEPPFGYMRIRPVWTYKKRESFGADGMMSGDLEMAMAAVEFNKGMPSKYIVTHKDQWASLYAYVKSLQAPKFPEKIDAALAEQGQRVFETTCSGCHGRYGAATGGRHREKVISLEEVGTDPDRADAATPALIDALNRSQFGEKVHMAKTNGYVAPPLDGIWSRGPYLHNGSVPTLADLLLPPSQRPVSFYVGGDTAYDLRKIGVEYVDEIAGNGIRRGARNSTKQFEFDTLGPGNSNRGHEFANGLTAEERAALLEYLKSL